MDIQYLIIIIGFIACMIVSFALLARGGVETFRPSRIFNPQNLIYGLYIVFALVTVGTAALFADYHDFVSDMNFASFIAPLLGGLVLIACSIMLPRNSWYLAAQLLIICPLVIFFDSYTIHFSSAMPLWADKILTVLLWFAAINSLNVLLGIEALAETQVISVCFGIFILYILLGGLPLLLGIAAIFLIGCLIPLLIYRWYPPKIQLPARSYSLIGYAFSWLIISGSVEFDGSILYIFSVFLVLENLIAYAKKLTFIEKYQNPSSNTVTYQTNLTGLSPDLICRYVLRTNFIFVVIGCFQFYAPDSWSIPSLATLIGIWNLYRLYNWNVLPHSLKESKQQLISDFKTGIEQVKKNINGEE